MSRSGYCEDGDGVSWALIRYRGAVNAAIKGARGQEFLRHLLATLDAMPDKVLVAGDLEADGQFCALGVAGHVKGLNLAIIDTYDHATLSGTFNIAESLAREIMWVNDEHVNEWKWVQFEICGPLRFWQERLVDIRVEDTDAKFKRWQTVRDWVAICIATSAKANEES